MMRSLLRLRPVLLPALALSAAVAWAQPVPSPQGVLTLSASASVEVTRDVLALTFAATRDGADAGAVQAELKRALDAALTEARKAAAPQQVEVSTGNFSLYPRYAPKGGIAGWQGRAEMVVQGRDMDAIARLAGRISTMTVARVVQGVSRELREKVEGEAAAQAIARFRAKAADYAKAFGYAGYAIREVNVSAADMAPPVPVMAMRAKAAGAPADESLPVEAGKGTVVISVSGSVQMTR